jgi:ElaB/YqjD/DUF883 family membrane-anchored ribosome-binding protein
VSTIPNDPTAGAGVTEHERARRTTTDRVAEKAHRTIDGAAETANEAERELRRTAAETADRVRRSEEQLVQAVDDNVEKVKAYIEKNPIASAGIAFVAGLVLSNLLRR